MDRKRDLDALIESTMAFVKDVKREPIPVCLPLWQQSNEHLQTHLNQRAFFWCEHFDFSRRGFPLLRFLRAEKRKRARQAVLMAGPRLFQANPIPSDVRGNYCSVRPAWKR